jgi:hypothetical protein
MTSRARLDSLEADSFQEVGTSRAFKDESE